MNAYITNSNLDGKVEAWTESLSSFDRPSIAPDPSRTALLVIDMQKYFTQEDGGAFLPASAAVLPRIMMLIEEFRRRKLPVIFTRHVHKTGDDDDMMRAWWREVITDGAPGSDLDDRIAPRRDEMIIEKNRYSAFFETGLEKLLRSMKTNTLIITGVMTNLCCESTARDAFFRNFQVFLPMDATAAIDETMHFGTLLNLSYGFARTIPAAELIELTRRTG